MRTQAAYIEELNYSRDIRTHGDQNADAVLVYYDEDDNEIRKELPTHWEVCPTCQGEGKHVNPSIDAGGLTRDDFDEEPGFLEDYMSGVYDVVCNGCGGRRVVRAVTWSELSEHDRKILEDQEREEEEYESLCRAERLMGC